MDTGKVYDVTTHEIVVDRLRMKYTNGLTYGWKSSRQKNYDQGHWNRNILPNYTPFTFDHAKMPMIKRHPEIQHMWDRILEVLGPRTLIRCYVNGYTYGTDGYYHQDDIDVKGRWGPDSVSETCILYLNKEWHEDWGGETNLWDKENEEVMRSVVPKRNRLFIFDSDIWHRANPVSRLCRPLRTVLVFKSGDPRSNDPMMTWLHENCPDVPHSGKTFFEHLYNVGTQIMRLTGQRNIEASKAGFLHAIYSTEYFKHNGDFSRDTIRGVVGDYPEELIFTFCQLKDRTNVITNNTNGWDTKMWRDMMLIEAANMVDNGLRSPECDKEYWILRRLIEEQTTILEGEKTTDD